MKDPRDNSMAAGIIACGVFKPVLADLSIVERRPFPNVKYLPTNLHLHPKRLRQTLNAELAAASEAGRRTVCLYGQCCPDIDELCSSYGAHRVRGCHCYEILLGAKRFQTLMDETAGTFFLERELIRDFDRICAEVLELHDEEVRKYMFAHYRRVVYVRQPSDEDLADRASDVARFLELALDVIDADYSQLEKELGRIFRKIAHSGH